MHKAISEGLPAKIFEYLTTAAKQNLRGGFGRFFLNIKLIFLAIDLKHLIQRTETITTIYTIKLGALQYIWTLHGHHLFVIW